ncbi:hypothetical protein A4X13_0g9304, partial [Tilletia indica]
MVTGFDVYEMPIHVRPSREPRINLSYFGILYAVSIGCDPAESDAARPLAPPNRISDSLPLKNSHYSRSGSAFTMAFLLSSSIHQPTFSAIWALTFNGINVFI